MDQNKAIEELEFIKKVMQDSKRTVVDNGMGYIIWGILIVIGLLSTFISVVNQTYGFYWNWVVVVGIGWIYSLYDIITNRIHKRKRNKTFTSKILGSIWFATGIGMTILGFLMPITGALHGQYISPMLSVLLGIAFFISSVVYDYWWLMMISVGWWITAIIMFFVPGIYTMLIMAGEMLFFQVVPGIILYTKFKKEQQTENA